MRRLDGITDSMDMKLGKLQEIGGTGSPGTLQSVWLQRVRQDLLTEKQNTGFLMKTLGSFCNIYRYKIITLYT